MSRATHTLAALTIAAATALAAAPTSAVAACAERPGRGWGTDQSSARFQAWEAVLQGTSWPMWAAWMASGAQVGKVAAGYTVSNIREKCGPHPSGRVCYMQARICGG